jgi:hypothetical protein
MIERGATENEVESTIGQGESFPAKYGRMGFRRNFSFESEWMGQIFKIKQIEVFAVKEEQDWLVLTVITKYF